MVVQPAGSTEDEPPKLEWVKSSYSVGTNACVELAAAADSIAVRDSKKPDQPPLFYTQKEIRAFFAGVLDGEFNTLLTDPPQPPTRRWATRSIARRMAWPFAWTGWAVAGAAATMYVMTYFRLM
jgi:hypothetical protein